jgi:class I fructose-bisphosphate aldolase
MNKEEIVSLLGEQKAEYLLNHQSKTFDRESLYLPRKDFVERYWKDSNRNIPTLRSIQALSSTGRLKNTGYVSILPVDQGIVLELPLHQILSILTPRILSNSLLKVAAMP